MDTHFAPAEREDQKGIARQTEIVVNHPVISGMLKLVNGMLAVLNDKRQIISLNHELIRYLGIEDSADVLGLRPGEAVDCRHATDMPGGCGTGQFCDSCGAAIAIVTALKDEIPVTRKCALEIDRNGKTQDIFLQVQSVPVSVEKENFVLLFLQDISAAQKWAAMEQIFFHDINNILASVVMMSNHLLMRSGDDNRDMIERLTQSSMRISQEVEMQRCLLNSETYSYQPVWAEVSVASLFSEIKSIFKTHPEARGKNVIVPTVDPAIVIRTDFFLLMRVLTNMVVNACEATDEGGNVMVAYKDNGRTMLFSVWNREEIPIQVRRRVFQRNFSSKSGLGRGIGTYSMKLFGEDMLGGKVDFISTPERGTTFRIILDKSNRPSFSADSPT